MESLFYKYKIYIIFIFIPLSLTAEPLLLSEDKAYNLAPFLSIHETSETLSIDDVLKDPIEWKHNLNDKVGRGFSSNHFWFHFNLKNENSGSSWYVSLSLNQLDLVELYEMNKDGTFLKYTAGDHIPFRRWSTDYHYPTFRIYLDMNETKDFYIHIKTTSTVSFDIDVYGPGEMKNSHFKKNLFQWIYFFLTVIYILFLIYLSRHYHRKGYLYLIILALNFYIYLFSKSGNGFQFWPEFPSLQDRFLVISVSMLLFVSTLFVKEFLNLKIYQPRMNYLFMAFMFLSIPLLFFFIEINIFLHRWLIYIGFSVIIASFIALIRAYFTGQKYVKNLIYLWLLMMGGAVIRGLTLLGLIPFYEWTVHADFYLYPFALFFIVKSLFAKYGQLVSENQELKSLYGEMVLKLESRPQKSKLANLDLEEIRARVENMVKTSDKFYSSKFSLPVMSSELNLRPDQLSEFLNSQLGISFSQFLNTIRINKVCDLMRDFPEKNNLEIAFLAGFGSKSVFNQAFRDILHTSPSDYRKKIKG